MQLTGKQKSFLRGLSHELHPVVMVGKEGVSEAVIRKVHLELQAHELIKVRIGTEGEQSMEELAEQIAARTESAVAQQVGHVVVLYRRKKKGAVIVLPK